MIERQHSMHELELPTLIREPASAERQLAFMKVKYLR